MIVTDGVGCARHRNAAPPAAKPRGGTQCRLNGRHLAHTPPAAQLSSESARLACRHSQRLRRRHAVKQKRRFPHSRVPASIRGPPPDLARIRVDLTRFRFRPGIMICIRCEWEGSKEKQPSAELYPEFKEWMDYCVVRRYGPNRRVSSSLFIRAAGTGKAH